jgi:hypothetical protein
MILYACFRDLRTTEEAFRRNRLDGRPVFVSGQPTGLISPGLTGAMKDCPRLPMVHMKHCGGEKRFCEVFDRISQDFPNGIRSDQDKT